MASLRVREPKRRNGGFPRACEDSRFIPRERKRQPKAALPRRTCFVHAARAISRYPVLSRAAASRLGFEYRQPASEPLPAGSCNEANRSVGREYEAGYFLRLHPVRSSKEGPE